MTAALYVLARQLSTQITGYGQRGNPVAGFIRAARRACWESLPGSSLDAWLPWRITWS